MEFNPCDFFPSPSGRLHSSCDEPPPSPARSLVSPDPDIGMDLDLAHFEQESTSDPECSSPQYGYFPSCLEPLSTKRHLRTRARGRRHMPLSPISERSMSTVSLSAVVSSVPLPEVAQVEAVEPAAPVAPQQLPTVSEPSCSTHSTYPDSEYSDGCEDLETEAAHTDESSWLHHGVVEEHERSSQARDLLLFAASMQGRPVRPISRPNSRDKPRGLSISPPAHARENSLGLRNAISLDNNLRQSPLAPPLCDSLGDEVRINANHPFSPAGQALSALVASPTLSSAPITPTISMPSLLSPLRASAFPISRSDSELSLSPITPVTPVTPRIAKSEQSSPQVSLKPSLRLRGAKHARALTAADAFQLPPPVPLVASTPRRMSYQPVSAVPVHSPASPFSAPRPAPAAPMRKPATALTFPAINPGAKHQCHSKHCCFLDLSDDQDAMTSRARVVKSSLTWLNRRHLSLSKDLDSDMHEHPHNHSHSNYHAPPRRIMGKAEISHPIPMPTVSVTPARPDSWTLPPNIPNLTPGSRHSFSSPSLREPTIEPPMPQYILPPSELPTPPRRRSTPIGMEFGMNSSMSSDSSSDEDSDAEGEAHVDVRTHAPRISFGLAPSGSMGELAQHKTLKAIDAGANRGGRRATTFSVPIVLYDLPAQAKPQVQSQLKHKAKPKPRIATDACHSFRYAHHPNATDNDSDDELALVLDTPFSPSTSGYERDGFCMPVA